MAAVNLPLIPITASSYFKAGGADLAFDNMMTEI